MLNNNCGDLKGVLFGGNIAQYLGAFTQTKQGHTLVEGHILVNFCLWYSWEH